MRRPRSLRLLASIAIVSLALLAGCRRVPISGGANDQVEIRNTLSPLVAALKLNKDNVPDGPRDAWLAWESANADLLRAANALTEDPGDQLLTKIAVSPDATLSLLTPFDEHGPEEAKQLLETLETKLGTMPPSVLVFGVARAWQPVFRGTLDGRMLTLLNARHVAFATPGARQAGIARALFRMMHESRAPDSNAMGPLARRVYREGAAALAVRMLVPQALEEDVLELEAKQLSALRAREALIARELLAALDSANEAELARFFSNDVRDPLLPRGAGRFISDRLFQRLAADQGSVERPLKLQPAEFVQRARRILQVMAAGK